MEEHTGLNHLLKNSFSIQAVIKSKTGYFMTHSGIQFSSETLGDSMCPKSENVQWIVFDLKKKKKAEKQWEHAVQVSIFS